MFGNEKEEGHNIRILSGKSIQIFFILIVNNGNNLI